MKNRSLIPLALAIAAFGANATTITFEETPSPRPGCPSISACSGFQIGSVVFSGGGVQIDNWPAGSSQSVLAASPTHVMAYGPYNYSQTITMVDGGEFDFLGASFACICNQSSLRLLGYKIDGSLYDMTFDEGYVVPNILSVDWKGIVALEFYELPTLGLSYDGWRGMDNFTYQAVPTPPAAFLFTAALGLLELRRKRYLKSD